MNGVIRTRVGYAGGSTLDPTYRRIGDHAECIQVDYDASLLTYADLLHAFLGMHDPTRPNYSTQYASMVLAHDDGQFSAAEATLGDLSRATGKRFSTRLARLDRFYVAEDYHQKYALRADKVLMGEMRGYYPGEEELRESTAAARLNGFAYGLGGRSLLDAEIEMYGLTPAGRDRLHAKVGGG